MIVKKIITGTVMQTISVLTNTEMVEAAVIEGVVGGVVGAVLEVVIEVVAESEIQSACDTE